MLNNAQITKKSLSLINIGDRDEKKWNRMR